MHKPARTHTCARVQVRAQARAQVRVQVPAQVHAGTAEGRPPLCLCTKWLRCTTHAPVHLHSLPCSPTCGHAGTGTTPTHIRTDKWACTSYEGARNCSSRYTGLSEKRKSNLQAMIFQKHACAHKANSKTAGSLLHKTLPSMHHRSQCQLRKDIRKDMVKAKNTRQNPSDGVWSHTLTLTSIFILNVEKLPILHPSATAAKFPYPRPLNSRQFPRPQRKNYSCTTPSPPSQPRASRNPYPVPRHGIAKRHYRGASPARPEVPLGLRHSRPPVGLGFRGPPQLVRRDPSNLAFVQNVSASLRDRFCRTLTKSQEGCLENPSFRGLDLKRP